jgi:hypothetical protein
MDFIIERLNEVCNLPSSISPLATAAGTTPLVLWSTNTYLKNRIQQQFHGGRHYVWCSPVFEGAALPRYAIGSVQPASSDPATIYRQLHRAVSTRDAGNEKIASQKKILKALAVKWHKDGAISQDQRDEIVAMITKSELIDWRPLIYVIPYPAVAARVHLVPRPRRASHEPEYILVDLVEEEFHIIEPVPCLTA